MPLQPNLRLILLLAAALSVSASAQILTTPGAPNTAAQQAKPYVVLVSLDGFRYDYIRKYNATHLAELARTGATAPQGMLPSYPSLTFPNHLSLVTGLFPEHHGIVANTFYDPARGQTYTYRDSASSADGTWYTGTPLWSLAEQQGMRAASFFWPASEATIAGQRPDEYFAFNDKLDDRQRLNQIAAWLAEPPATRPHFITLYYSNTDHAGHAFGPDSSEEADQVHHVDDLIGELKTKLDATHLPVNLIVVADHGMIAADPNWVTLDQFADLTHFKTEGSLLYADSDAEAQKAYLSFRAHPDPRFTAYRRADVPASLHYSENPRTGDPVIVPNGAFVFRFHNNNSTRKPPIGEHGYDPARMPEMKALFLANGPDIVAGTELKTFPNVDLYSFVAAILGLQPAPNDGSLQPMLPALRNPHPAP